MKTVKVRIPVVVDHLGNWNAAGWSHAEGKQADDEGMFRDLLDFIEEGERRYVLVAELEIPERNVEVVEVEAVPYEATGSHEHSNPQGAGE